MDSATKSKILIVWQLNYWDKLRHLPESKYINIYFFVWIRCIIGLIFNSGLHRYSYFWTRTVHNIKAHMWKDPSVKIGHFTINFRKWIRNQHVSRLDLWNMSRHVKESRLWLAMLSILFLYTFLLITTWNACACQVSRAIHRVADLYSRNKWSE